MKKAIREVILALKTITYFTAWMLVISILYEWSTPVAGLSGLGLYTICTLAIARGGNT